MAVKVVKEITSGYSASLSLNSGGAPGGAGDSMGVRYQRAWKIVYDTPSDHFRPGVDVRSYIGVTIGSRHPVDAFCVCDSIDIKPDGDSRFSYIVTASYSAMPISLEQGGMNDQNEDPRTQSPESRPANWSMETSSIEAPSWMWKPIWPPQAPQPPNNLNGWGVAVNPAGDMYDGVATMQPLVSIKVEQTQNRDPSMWSMYVGYVNTAAFRVGALNCEARSVMLKGTTSSPAMETVGNVRWRGWKATYEFLYKPGYNSYLNQFLGWDIAVPVSGWNVKNVAGATADATVEKGSLALKLTGDNFGTIANWPNAAIEPTLVNENSRANVLIAAPGAKAAQRPSAQPVALNWNGTPRKLTLAPLVQRSQVYMDFDMRVMGLRLR